MSHHILVTIKIAYDSNTASDEEGMAEELEASVRQRVRHLLDDEDLKVTVEEWSVDAEVVR